MLTSLTGGGGLSASSSASSANGDFSSSPDYNVGTMSFGIKSGVDNNQIILIAGFAIVALLVWKK